MRGEQVFGLVEGLEEKEVASIRWREGREGKGGEGGDPTTQSVEARVRHRWGRQEEGGRGSCRDREWWAVEKAM